VNFHRTDKLLITYFAFIKYLNKDENTEGLHTVCTNLKKKPMIQLGGRFSVIFSMSLVYP
jgi:hypothetical protein